MCRSHNNATATKAAIATARLTTAGVGQPPVWSPGSVGASDAGEESGVGADAGMVDDGRVVAAAPISRPGIATIGRGWALADVGSTVTVACTDCANRI